MKGGRVDGDAGVYRVCCKSDSQTVLQSYMFGFFEMTKKTNTVLVLDMKLKPNDVTAVRLLSRSLGYEKKRKKRKETAQLLQRSLCTEPG